MAELPVAARYGIVFLGAGFGGCLRYGLGGWVSSMAPRTLPWGTIVVNVSGCLVIGLVAGLLIGYPQNFGWRLFAVTGVLGGYTTFSAFSLETVNLFLGRHLAYALTNVFGSCLAGVLATWAGFMLTRSIGSSSP
jgi:CrcB protein